MRPLCLASQVLLLFACFNLQAADPILLPNGAAITPAAAPHSVQLPLNPGVASRPNFALGQAVTTALSPDGTQLLVLTSGYNRGPGPLKDSPEFVFVYDVTSYPPRQVQALPIPNSFCGLAWNPNGQEFYVSGGPDDSMYIFARRGIAYYRAASVPMVHAHGNGLITGPNPKPVTAGIAVNRSGTVAAVANFYNDSISLVDLKTRARTSELDLRPGVSDPSKSGVPGGEYPYWIAIQGDDRAYISSTRDREIVVVSLTGKPAVSARIPVRGQPNRILLNRAGSRLYVALDNADAVTVIDTGTGKAVDSFGITAPAALLPGENLPRGANPNSLALSPDERTLYVTDGGTNAIAVVSLDPAGPARVTGLIPTGWYPNSVSVSSDGGTLYAVNGKSVPGPNLGNCRADVKAPKIPDCARTPFSYVYTLEKASLWAAPVPHGDQLAALTTRVAENNHFAAVRSSLNDPVIAQLRQRIKHVIYIIKENRTYDQVLGDLEKGDGDPSITEFPEPLTPNHHALARNFVTLDNFYDSGEVSGVGWNWSTAARTTDYTEKSVPPNYASRAFDYDWEGTNRGVNVGIGDHAERLKGQPMLQADPNLLPGTGDVAAPDSQFGDAGEGYIWDEALRARLTVRNYGIFCDLARYNDPKTNKGYIPISKTPFADKLPQATPSQKTLLDKTDLYYRSFDQNNSDYYLFKEWEREFDQFTASGNLPNLSLIRLAHDHFGSFGTALYGLNTPALQISDNDYAIGLLIAKVAASRYASDTLIFIIEDDAQDGPDHVDAHRSLALIAGPYVKQGAVVSERYTTVSMIRTMEAILGIQPSSIYSAATAPMSEIFDLNLSKWSYTPAVPELLRTTELPLPARAANERPGASGVLAAARNQHNAAWWQKKLGDMDFDEEDKLDTPRFNQVLWKGTMGKQPYPKVRSRKNLRENRQALLNITRVP
ncbi:MAG TPA: bifunctional YncE family protein/alkaline phosphatase family protein [Bryobacteraceae bacterium]|jgi:DNA-binding beta-propeller fold protein YncE|nr:bifunctional YncE family protein/alkaline phosphatase family protein [Bryobacteraceae bacterium]